MLAADRDNERLRGAMQDIRLAFRSLKGTPIVTAVAVLSLALGIGANTAIFSLVDRLLPRSLPVADPQRLVLVSTSSAVQRGLQWVWSYGVFDEIRRRPALFDSVCAWSPNSFNLAAGGLAEPADGLWVSGSFFSTLGVRAAAGRVLTDDDDARGGGTDGAVAVLSDRFARRRFGSPTRAIGQRLTLDKIPFIVVGVTSPDFFGPEVGRTFDVIVPIGTERLVNSDESYLGRRGDLWQLTIMARLRHDQSAQTTATAIHAVEREIREATVSPRARPEYRDAYLRESFALVPAPAGQSVLREKYRQPLLALMIVVALVLTIACGNIANLLLARASARRHELSVRLALGASRWRLARQLFAESIVLAIASSLAGLLVARWAGALVVQQLSSRVDTVFLDLHLGWRVLAFTIGVAAMTVLLFGVSPALGASRTEAVAVLRTSATLARSGAAASWVVAAQVALSLVLVVAAGLFVRTFSALATRPAGFDRDRVLVVRLDSRRTSVTPAARASTYEAICDRVRALPGVSEAAVSMLTPVDPQGAIVLRADVPGAAAIPDGPGGANAFTNVVSPGWFRTLGVPLLSGRNFTATDESNSPRVAIVNNTLARLLNVENALGRTITITVPARRVSMEIVGVAGDAIYRSLRETVPPTIYTPINQLYMSPGIIDAVSLSVRAGVGAPATLAKAVVSEIEAVNPELTLAIQPLADQLNASLTQERIVAQLSAFFGVLALLLAAIGLYGVTAGAVAMRRTELGIRMALGAAPGAVVRLVLSRVAVLVGGGVIAGAALSWWASRFIAAMLYQLQPGDATTLAGAAAVLVTTSAIAGWLPAWRASRIEPAQVLRES